MWDGLLDWMDETGERLTSAATLMRDPARLAEKREHVFAVIEAFTRTLPRQRFFHEAQRRRLPWAAVLDLEEVATCPQLAGPGRARTDLLRRLSGPRRDAADPAPRRGAERAADLARPLPRHRGSPGSPGPSRPGTGHDPGAARSTTSSCSTSRGCSPGPYATRVLADHGAHVVKVESRHRPDPTRFSQFTHLSRGEFDPDTSGYFNNVNRNKRSITLNLRKAEGVEAFCFG